MTEWDSCGDLQGQRRIKNETILIIEYFFVYDFSIHSK